MSSGLPVLELRVDAQLDLRGCVVGSVVSAAAKTCIRSILRLNPTHSCKKSFKQHNINLNTRVKLRARPAIVQSQVLHQLLQQFIIRIYMDMNNMSILCFISTCMPDMSSKT